MNAPVSFEVVIPLIVFRIAFEPAAAGMERPLAALQLALALDHCQDQQLDAEVDLGKNTMYVTAATSADGFP